MCETCVCAPSCLLSRRNRIIFLRRQVSPAPPTPSTAQAKGCPALCCSQRTLPCTETPAPLLEITQQLSKAHTRHLFDFPPREEENKNERDWDVRALLRNVIHRRCFHLQHCWSVLVRPRSVTLETALFWDSCQLSMCQNVCMNRKLVSHHQIQSSTMQPFAPLTTFNFLHFLPSFSVYFCRLFPLSLWRCYTGCMGFRSECPHESRF